MKPELRTLLTSRGVVLPGENEIDHLCDLEARWRALDERRALVSPLRVAEDQKAAHEAFLADPSEENEMQVAVLADTGQTLLRYAARHRALTDAMRMLSREAAEVLSPFLAAITAVVNEEMERRKEAKTTLYAANDPRVKECRPWVDDLDHACMRVLRVKDGDLSPMELAAFFVTRPGEDGK